MKQDRGLKHIISIVDMIICDIFYFYHFDLKGHLQGQIDRTGLGKMLFSILCGLYSPCLYTAHL